MKNILAKCRNNIYILYTMLFAIICGLSFYSFIKLGKSFVWNPDGIQQHYAILYDFNRMIKNGFKLFSWNMGLGLDVISQYSYYILGDPFAYMSLLFPMKYLGQAYHFLIILRMYCVGIAFIAYCKYNKQEGFSVLVGAIIYTFCGYILYAAIKHPYFTNAAIILPLVFMGIDKILKENKYTFFTVIIAILAIMNYYFLYIITILAVIYAIIKYVVEYRENGIKDFGIKFGKTALCYIIGVMVSAIVLLPTIYGFLNSDRSGVSYTYYGLTYYEKLFFGQPDTLFWSKTFVSSILLTIIPVAILNRKDKENKTILINILATIIILLVPFFGSVMNGFSFQSNRWIFGYAFFMAYLVVLNLNEDMKYNKKQIICMLVSVLVFGLLSLIATRIRRDFVLIPIIPAILMILVIIIRNKIGKDKKTITNICKLSIVLLVAINCISYAWFAYDQKGCAYVKEFVNVSKINRVYKNYVENIPQFDKCLKSIKKQDKGFYRIGTSVYNNSNISIRQNYKSLNMYLSIGNKYISNFSKDLLILGINPTNALRELDSRTKVTTLLGCKYYVVPKDRIQYVPYGYEQFKEEKDSVVYQNKNSLGVGIFYNNYILQQDYDKLTPLEKEQALLETAVIKEVPNNKNVVYSKQRVEDIKKNTSKEIKCNINKKKKKLEITFNDKIKNSELYLYFDNLKYDDQDEYYVKVSYNGVEKKQRVRDKRASAYYVETPYILVNLGYIKEQENGKINVELTGMGNFKYDSIKLLAVPMDNYENDIAKLKENEFKVEGFKNNYIKGNISNKESGILQISTSYSDGWNAYVDGRKVDIINVNKGFIGIELEEGQHEIIFKYSTPWLKIGIIISVIGIIVLSIIITRRGKENSSKMKNFIRILKEHWEYRQQIFKLAKSDLIKTYRGAALGWSWAIIKPAVTIFVYWFAFSIGLRAGKDVAGYPFFLWLIAGVVPWFYMSDMLTAGTDSIRRYSYLVTKMKFPVSTIPTFVSISKLSINLILLVVTILIFCGFGFMPDIYYLQIIFFIIIGFIFWTIWALFSSLLAAISKDFANLVKSFVSAVFWLSGIIWNPNTIKIGWLKKLLMCNPVTYLVNGFRNSFIYKIWFWEQPKRLLYFCIVTLVMLILALWAYRKVRKEIPDVL